MPRRGGLRSTVHADFVESAGTSRGFQPRRRSGPEPHDLLTPWARGPRIARRPMPSPLPRTSPHNADLMSEIPPSVPPYWGNDWGNGWVGSNSNTAHFTTWSSPTWIGSWRRSRTSSTWYRQYEAYFTTRFPGRKMDLIVELSKFHFSPSIADCFGRYRAKVLREFTGRSYCVNQSARERAFMYTSSVLRSTPANHFASLDDGLKALLDDRARASEVVGPPSGKGAGHPKRHDPDRRRLP
jgi:hypothetical protein